MIKARHRTRVRAALYRRFFETPAGADRAGFDLPGQAARKRIVPWRSFLQMILAIVKPDELQMPFLQGLCQIRLRAQPTSSIQQS
jgi:hypothetical protein